MVGKWLLMKRGLYYRPNSQGYTGLKAEAGRYTDEEVAIYRRQDGYEVSVVEANKAADIAPSCYPDIAQRHLQDLLSSAQAEIARLTIELDRLRAELDGRARVFEFKGVTYRADRRSYRDASGKLKPFVTVEMVKLGRELAVDR